nr:menaquinone-specific isochorismate synthase [Cyanidioschyzonaceae sp. 1]
MGSINCYCGYTIFLFIFDIHMSIRFSLKHVSIDHTRFYCVRLQWPLTQTISLIQWLQSQSLYPKISWIDRDTSWHLVACDQIFASNHLPNALATSFIRGDHNMCFRLIGIASSSPPTTFCLPRYELHHKAHEYLFVINCIFHNTFPVNEIKALIQQMSEFTYTSPCFSCVQLLRIQYFPNLYRWNQTLIHLLTQMTQISKLVLARQKKLDFQHAINVFDWLTYKSNCFHFVFIWKPDLALITLSPERLYFRHKSTLITEAMAGTRARCTNPVQDALWCLHLYENEKDVVEQNWVRLDLETKLKALGKSLTSNDYAIYQTPYVQHLYVPFQVKLNAFQVDSELIKAIHPTAAICGCPMPQAYFMLQKYESFNRGAYACPIGWIGDNDAHLCVSIRCALIFENQVQLYAGSGIIPASLPKAEWNETENKFVW